MRSTHTNITILKPKIMKRRDFTKTLFGGGAAILLNPVLTSAASDASTAPWSVAFNGVTSDLAELDLKVQGDIPEACYGTLYRNGPALFERDGQRYSHWFDPDGMIQAFKISEKGISHHGRFVRTEKFKREEDAGRFLFDGAGSKIEGSFPSRNNDDGNVANTNIQPFQGELLALWEGGSAHRVDPNTLQTLGKKDWRDDLRGVPFSAHPRFDDRGDMWNIGSLPMPDNPALVLYHIGKGGDLKKVQVHRLGFGGYQHDFVLTPNYLIALNSSAVTHQGERFVDMFQWEADRPSQLMVFDKNDLSLVKTIEVPPAFVFHFGNAWESGGKITFTASQYKDAQFMKHGMARLAKQQKGPYHQESTLLRYTIDLHKGTAEIDKLSESLEFPGFDRRYPFAEQTLLGISESLDRPESMQSIITQVNPESGQEQHYDYGEDIIVEEPQFISDGSSIMGSGFIMHTYLNYKTERTGTAILKSDALADGPVAMAEMDRCLPLGFHGCFLSASN
jgi:all-trans-8'-apo-beta-carotenal 15,15'-oxygenase